MDNERIQRVRQAMDEANLDALVCRLPQNVLMLSGYWPMIGWTYLVFPKDCKPTCIAPHSDENEAGEALWDADLVTFLFGVLEAGNPCEAVTKALQNASRGKGWKRVGWEPAFESLIPPWNAAEPSVLVGSTRRILTDVFGEDHLVDATALLTAQMACKTAMEIDKIRTVNEISTFGLQALLDNVDVGRSGVELVAAVEQAIMTKGTGYKGAKRVRAFAQVSTGPQETSLGYRPMVISTARPMQSGDLALLEMGVVADGFWCDRTRVRVAGKPTDQQVDVHKWVLDAQITAIDTIRSGVKAHLIDEAARALLKGAGYGDGFNHITGHGVGFGYHEPSPMLMPDNDEVLEVGMVSSVEPGVYYPEMGGIREEDNVLITENGAEILGPFSKELF